MVLQIHFHFNLLIVEDGASLFAIILFWLSFEWKTELTIPLFVLLSKEVFGIGTVLIRVGRLN